MKWKKLPLAKGKSVVAENKQAYDTTSWKSFHRSKVIEPCELKEKISELKCAHKRIVTTNGSFDLLHAGHLHTLYEASKLGDVFIVALNSDASVQSYKGPKRPIIPCHYRVQMMAALSFVDFVTVFEEGDPRKLLEVIAPDVHINSAEYGENCIEKSVVESGGGVIKLIEKIDGLSTSQVLKRVLACTK